MADGRIDDSAVSAFMGSDYAAVVRTVSLVCGSVSLAEELVQEALLRAWEGRSVDIHSLPAWVTRVALNLARSAFRRRSAQIRAYVKLGQRHHERDQTDLIANQIGIATALRHLSRRQREVIVLHYLNDMEVAEVAQLLGISVGAAKTHLHRGRAALADVLGRPDDGG